MFSNLRRPDNRATKKTGMKRVRIKGIGKEGRNRGVSPAGTSFIFEKRMEKRITSATPPLATLQMQSAHLESGKERGKRKILARTMDLL
jgi:hypothetical protein